MRQEAKLGEIDQQGAMLVCGGQVDMIERCLGRPCDQNVALKLSLRRLACGRGTLGHWLALTMALLNMNTVGAGGELHSESSIQSTLPIAVHAAPFSALIFCILYLHCRSKRRCDLSRLHRLVVCCFWLAALYEVAMSTWYIGIGKHDMFYTLLQSGKAAVSVTLIFQLLNHWTAYTRRGHVIATWLRHGIRRSWGENKEVMAAVWNSLDAVRCIAPNYSEKALAVAALSIAPLRWNKEDLGEDVWFELQKTGLEPEKWQGTGRLQAGMLFDLNAHCIMSLHRYLCAEWIFSQNYVFPQLWALESRKMDILERVETVMNGNHQPRIVRHLGFEKMWTYASTICLLVPEIRQVLCSEDMPLMQDYNSGNQILPSQDVFWSRIPPFANCICILIIASAASYLTHASYYRLMVLAVVGHFVLYNVWHGIASVVWALLLWGTARMYGCGDTALSVNNTEIWWKGIIIKCRVDEDIDQHDEVLISLAMLYKENDLTLQACDIHSAKSRIVSRFGSRFLDQVRSALKRANRKVEVQMAAGLGPGVAESITKAEIKDLRKLYDENTFGSLMEEIRVLMSAPTPSGHKEEPQHGMQKMATDVDMLCATDAAVGIAKQVHDITSAAKTNFKRCQAAARETSTIGQELTYIKAQRDKMQNIEPSLKNTLQTGLQNVKAALNQAEHLVKEAGCIGIMANIWNARAIARGFCGVGADLTKAMASMKEASTATQNVQVTASEQLQRRTFSTVLPVLPIVEKLPVHLQGLEYNHNVIHFLKQQLDTVSDLERPPGATLESWQEFEKMMKKGQRLIRKHQSAFNLSTFYETRDAVDRVERICRALCITLEKWGVDDTVKCSCQVPEHLVTKDGQRLNMLVAYIFLNDDCDFEDAQVCKEWVGIRRKHEGDMKRLQPICDDDIARDRKIGDGANGTVYKGHWKGLPVAVKIRSKDVTNPRTESIAAFFKEVSLHASFRRDHQVVEWRATTKSGWLVMELADANLKSKLRSGAPGLPWHLKLKYAREAGAGLECMHSKDPPVMHCDVKSTNFLVFGVHPETNTVKIADFGQSEAFTRTKRDTAGIPGGTLEWQAPEIYDEEPHTLASDVFSFGVVLYEIVTGNHPYGVERMSRDRAQAVVTKKKCFDNEEPCLVKPSDCPEAMHLLMKQCCHLEPSKRPTMETVCWELAKLPEEWTPP